DTVEQAQLTQQKRPGLPSKGGRGVVACLDGGREAAGDAIGVVEVYDEPPRRFEDRPVGHGYQFGQRHVADVDQWRPVGHSTNDWNAEMIPSGSSRLAMSRSTHRPRTVLRDAT